MGQEDILKVLEKHSGTELTSTEIAEIIGGAGQAIRKSINRLFKDSLQPIKRRELSFEEKKERYGKVVNTRIIVYKISLSDK